MEGQFERAKGAGAADTLLLGFLCLTIMVLTHVAERVHLFPGMDGARQTVPVTTSILSVPYLLCAFDRWHDLDQL